MMIKFKEYLEEEKQEIYQEIYPGIKKSGKVYSVKDKKSLKQIKKIEDGASVKIGNFFVDVKFGPYDIPLQSTIEKNNKLLDIMLWPRFLDIWLHNLKKI